MSQNYSEENSVFKDPVFKVANIFGIVPYVDTKQQKLLHRNVFKLHGLLFASLTIMVTLVSFYNMQAQIFSFTSTALACIEFLIVSISVVSLLIMMFGSSLWNMKSWERLLKLTSTSEHRIGCTKRYFLDFQFILLTIGCLPGLLLFVISLLAVGVLHAAPVLLLQLSRHIVICLMCNIVVLTRNKYKAVNNILTNIKVCTVIKTSTIINLQQAKTIYLEADKITVVFNEIFGLPLLLLLANTVAMLLMFLAIITERGLKYATKSVLSAEVIALNVFYTVVSEFGPTVIIFACDSAVQEANKLLKRCYKLHENLPLLAREKDELKRLRDLIQDKRPTFSAADFFEIKRSTLLALISTATTYMIVILQFNFL